MSEYPLTLAERAVIHLAGPDARALLQRVVTGDAEAVSPDRIVPAALLTPQGKVIVDFLMHEAPDGLYLDVLAAAADALLKKLTLYKLRADVEITRREDLVPLWSPTPLEGPAARDPRGVNVWRAIGAPTPHLGDNALEVVEIINGAPAFGRDYGEAEVFPTDVNLDLHDGIAWTKGCYVGQEVVSRMKRRGTIRKRTVLLKLDGAAVAGDAVLSEGKTLGEISSVDGQDALARLRIDRLQAAQGPITVNDSGATVCSPEELTTVPA